MKNIHSMSERSVSLDDIEESNQRNEHQISESTAMHDINMGDKIRIKSINHKKGEKKKCKMCPYVTAIPSHLKRHIKGMHETIRDHVCEDCGYATSQKCNLNYHRISVHKMGENKFKCELCPYKTYFKHTLKRHVKNVHLL